MNSIDVRLCVFVHGAGVKKYFFPMKTQSGTNYYNYLEFQAHHSSQNQNPLSIVNDVTIFHCFHFQLNSNAFNVFIIALLLAVSFSFIAKENKNEKLTVP